MKTIFQISLWLWLAMTAVAQVPLPPPPAVLRTFDWKDITAQIPGSQMVTLDGMSVLKIVKTNDEPPEVSLLAITNSSLIKKAYGIEWEMKYENVDAMRRELNLIYPPQAVGGDSSTNNYGIEIWDRTKNWDKYYFPIHPARYDNETRPDGLELKLSMPKGGTVYLRPIQLVGNASSTNWWTPQQAGLFGGIGGSVIGCLGAMTGILGSKGRARGLVLATVKGCIALGIILLAGGLTALILKQPYAVYYPLLLGGFILTIVFSVNLPSIQRRYDELEIRRMTSQDAMQP